MTEPALAHLPDWSSLTAGERVAATATCAGRLNKIGRKLNAVVDVLPVGETGAGALAGLPYAAKDMFATGNGAPTWGCKISPAEAGPRATVLKRLDAAGAQLVATAEMTEFAYEPSGLNASRGKVLNPWNVDAVPGGSSSGPAALVASGCVFVALGSDTGGSVRIPAHCCGVTALKPSWGAIPEDGAMPLAASLDTVGLIGRSARDLALVWPVVSGRAEAAPKNTGLRAAVMADAMAASTPEVRDVCRQAIMALSRLGIVIAQAGGFPEQADVHALTVMQAEAARAHCASIDDERVAPVLRKRLRKGLDISDDFLNTALSERDAVREGFLKGTFGEADLVLLPVMPIGTPMYAETDPSSPGFAPRTLYAMSRFTRFVNYLGLPAMAVPAGFDPRGLPVGLQIIGRPNSEALLLSVATQLQSVTDWHGRVPTAIANDIAAEKGMAA